MAFLRSTFLAASTMAAVASAVPEVVPYELANDCEWFPGGGWFLEVNECTDAETGETCEFEGFKNNVQFDDQNGGIISIVPDEEAETYNLNCMTGSRGVTMITVNATSELYGESVGMYDLDGAWTMAWGNDGEINPPRPHAHMVDGKIVDDLFMGQKNVTTWGIKYQDDGESEPYYSVRLLLDGGLEEGESETFLRVTT